MAMVHRSQTRSSAGRQDRCHGGLIKQASAGGNSVSVPDGQAGPARGRWMKIPHPTEHLAGRYASLSEAAQAGRRVTVIVTATAAAGLLAGGRMARRASRRRDEEGARGVRRLLVAGHWPVGPACTSLHLSHQPSHAGILANHSPTPSLRHPRNLKGASPKGALLPARICSVASVTHRETPKVKSCVTDRIVQINQS
ncbi:uncharacterized protein BO80DRAFT_84790 [Aspergillus ibericus CBS 121593]|uniref:Uncharacterized protein n=1 Tax=Aspergillus ibericus CBS 121593 TaxID=1448316 RepID=A0A395HI82_9EURO|nr:hypothetical protein BO80DRAFT_84790 [Aspergillus ibericus CBS 121593]RAL05964.1 hypothetical protein BO80DRAFT_84790 [Aspergillus ibericus CBS 121593]